MPAFQYHVLSANRPTLWASVCNQMLRKYKLNKIRLFQKKTGNFPNNCKDVRLQNYFFSAWEICRVIPACIHSVGWRKRIVLTSPQCQPKPSVPRWAEGWAQDKDSPLPVIQLLQAMHPPFFSWLMGVYYSNWKANTSQYGHPKGGRSVHSDNNLESKIPKAFHVFSTA